MLDFKSLAQEYALPIIESGHHHCHEGWIQTHCPFCADGTYGWHLGFSLEGGNFNCWRCGKHRAKDVLLRLLRDEETVRRAFSQYITENGRRIKPVQEKQRRLWTPPNLKEMTNSHRRYLTQRGFHPPILAEEWELRGTTSLSHPSWNWRIVFPIKTAEGRNVAWMGRSIKPDTKPKYKLSDKQHILIPPAGMMYGIEKVKDFVVIVEGPADVWRLGAGAVAILGVDWSMYQVAILKNYSRRYILLDADRAGQRQAKRLGNALAIYPGKTEIITGLDTDPGDMDQKEADTMMEEFRNDN